MLFNLIYIMPLMVYAKLNSEILERVVSLIRLRSSMFIVIFISCICKEIRTRKFEIYIYNKIINGSEMHQIVGPTTIFVSKL